MKNRKLPQAKKSLGQNFLTDKNKVIEIIKALDIQGKNVLEVGPGPGALTMFLDEMAGKLVVVEIDSVMIALLEETLENAKIIHMDFLDVDLNEMIKKDFQGLPTTFVSNLPYYIASKILFKVIESDSFNKIGFMIQKELADRIFAKPNTKDYGRLTVGINSLYKRLVKIDVPASCFTPKPNVESNFIIIERNNVQLPIESYLDFVKDAFQFKRKTLTNNLKGNKQVDKAKLLHWLDIHGYSESARAEEIEIEGFISLYKYLFPN